MVNITQEIIKSFILIEQYEALEVNNTGNNVEP